MPTGGVDILAGAGALAGVFGSAAPIIGGVLAGGELGAGIGGLEGLVTGGNVGQDILHGAEGGAITGGGIGLGGEIAGGLGATAGSIGATAGDVLGGAAGGALGSELTGGKPLTGALEGGAAGAFSGLTNASAPSAAATASGASTPIGGASPGVGSAGAISAPAGAGGGGDVSQIFQDAAANPGGANVGTQGIGNSGTGFQSTLSTPTADGIAATIGSGSSDSLGSVGAEAAKAPNSISNFISHPGLDSFGNIITSNPGAAISAVGLGADAAKQAGLIGNNTPKGERQLENIANQENQQGTALQSYLQTGTLPPGLQQGITQAADAAKAAIRSKYASMGSSGSTAEQQELAAVDSNAQAQGAQLATQLLQTGISETGGASALYEAMLKDAETSEGGLSSAIANFASAAGGGGGQTIRLSTQ